MIADLPVNVPVLRTEEIENPEGSERLRTTFEKWNKVCKEKLQTHPQLWNTLSSMDNLISYLCKMKFPDMRCFIVEDQTRVIQGLTLIKETDTVVEIDALMTSPENVDPNKKIKGVGRLLVERIVKELLQKNCVKRIELFPTEVAVGFYEHLGFRSSMTPYDRVCLYLPADKIEELYVAPIPLIERLCRALFGYTGAV